MIAPDQKSLRIPVGILGAHGRMGQALIVALESHPRLFLGTALDAGGDLDELLACAVAIDFTMPAASAAFAREAAKRNLPLVIGTTGLSEDQEDAVRKASQAIPIVYAANMSIGVTVLAALVEQAAKLLANDYDIEIAEMHHRHKADAPSGTALLLGRAAAAGRSVDLETVRADHRNGKRLAGEIGFASLRGGDVAGDHTVYFAGDGERLELTHRASSRSVFAQGALRAAEWVIAQKPGLYGMRDVLE